MLQATILRPFTERLMRSAEIGPGMRVLDLGCGAGDVSMLAAELVGPSGAVVGIDRNSQVIELATKRARTAGVGRVTFRDVPLEAFSDADLFDCVVGRYVLIHQSDPIDSSAQLRASSSREGSLLSMRSILPEVSILDPASGAGDAAGNLILAAFRDALPHHDSANRLVERFSDAGLPVPNLFREMLVGGGTGLASICMAR